ncbi:hypothetical protein EDEG_03589 [Edhazardia aedis USNM 41457]|uniref:40S ribosomal protein S7 n=1 Tax=Edhazardia aedis (strain USNM 41457) TaxID=1003232 RepID=J9DH64_EDHAE|nr:hypothetical protein EDEG_03589 [Edhazardia aedis USNM 41457]|eukprot:EJW01945.1 hypothetical protein EDEG_03589 [Edhazardia aedis USNM 41457]
MSKFESEKYVANLISYKIDKENKKGLEALKLDLIQMPDKTKIMIVYASAPIIANFKKHYTELVSKIRGDPKYCDYFVYPVRKKAGLVKKDFIKRLHEKWVEDLAFPALVKGRKSIFEHGARTEEAIIDNKFHMKDDELKKRSFVFKHLSGRDITFNMRSY